MTLRLWWIPVVAAVQAVVSAIFVGDLSRSWIAATGCLLIGFAVAFVFTWAAFQAEREPPLLRAMPTDVEPPAPLWSLKAVIESVNDPILVLAGDRIVAANSAACDLLGGAHIVGEDMRIALRHPVATEFLANPERRGSLALTGIGRRERSSEMRVADLGDQGMRLVQIIDRSEAQAAERARVDFVANASHELRTPLAAILGFVETLTDEAGEDPKLRQRSLGVILREARRMDQLIGDLFSLSRIEADKYRQPETLIALDQIARTVVTEMNDAESGADPGRARVHLAVAPIPPLRGDAGQLSQLLHNIIGNALKYGAPGTPVHVALRAEGQSILLSVSDEGEGIAAEHLPRLTQRFYRVDAGRSRSLGGTGLGLAIVKHIVERHRGRLDISSQLGKGSCVRISLPASAIPDQAGAGTPS